jgi:alpha-methylacyl-CoA racemase
MGPLAGVRIIELAAIGPVPFAGMMLADHGAEVIRIERRDAPAIGPGADPTRDPLRRSRRRIAVDLKSPAGVAVVRDLAARADGLIEGLRPGVTERLGLGPDALIAANPRLVYGRMTGWGQDGPLGETAGHDINYLALAGTLHALGRAGEPPTPPINLVGDFGGGGMLLAFGMVSAILHARATGEGQVVDCAMTDGAALLMTMVWGFRAEGWWRDERGVNLLDTGAPFYDTYLCADGRFLAVGAIEPAFFADLTARLGLSDDPAVQHQHDPRSWPAMRDRFARLFATQPRDAWIAQLGGDACVTPVLSLAEAPHHPHNAARGTFVESGGVTQPAPAPRYAATPADAPRMSTHATDADALLGELGYSPDRIAALRTGGVIA